MKTFLGGAGFFLALVGLACLGATGHLVAFAVFGALAFGAFAVFMEREMRDVRPGSQPVPGPRLDPSSPKEGR